MTSLSRHKILCDDSGRNSVFALSVFGIKTGRDIWCYNYSSERLAGNIKKTVNHFNECARKFRTLGNVDEHLAQIKKNKKTEKITWDDVLQRRFKSPKHFLSFEDGGVFKGQYRPFTSKYVYVSSDLTNRRPKSMVNIFPNPASENRVINVPLKCNPEYFFALMTDGIPDMGFIVGSTQSVPLYDYGNGKSDNDDLISASSNYGLTETFVEEVRSKYSDKTITYLEVFNYVYGVFHAPGFKDVFGSTLDKELPRVPLVSSVDDFRAFSSAGALLADLHIGYETIDPHPDVFIEGNCDHSEAFMVTNKKMTFAPGDDSKIRFNKHILIGGIPSKAHQYRLGGRSALECVMDQQIVKQDGLTRIVDDPNLYDAVLENPRYITDLIARVANVSVQTVDILEKLPALNLH